MDEGTLNDVLDITLPFTGMIFGAKGLSDTGSFTSEPKLNISAAKEGAGEKAETKLLENQDIRTKGNDGIQETSGVNDSNAVKSQAEKITDPGNTAGKTETSGLISESTENAGNDRVNACEESGVRKGNDVLRDETPQNQNNRSVKIQTQCNKYSGELQKVDNTDVAADALAKRIGGESRVKFSNDPDGREFDAISDEFIAQAKPALKTLNTKVRNQMKATFEAAKATGKKVYYQFEGVPNQSVIDKLYEYSERYGIDVVIDTTPLGVEN